MRLRRTIDLADVLRDAVLIVEHPSNVRYVNRTASDRDAYEELEGILVPLELEEVAIEQLRAHGQVNAGQPISEAYLDRVDEILAADAGPRFLKSDRARRAASARNWIHVVVDAPPSTVIELYPRYFGNIYGFGVTHGVVTWPVTSP